MPDRDHDPHSTKASLLLRIRDHGDSASWADFVSVYAPLIRGYCRRKGLQEADSADVEQEVLAQVARSIAAFEYEPGRGRFRDWLGKVTRSKIARFQEKAARGGRAVGGEDSGAIIDRIDGPAEDPEWTSAFHSRVLDVALDRVRPGFEPSTWSAFSGVWSEGRPAPEVARALGLTIDSVYAAKFRVLKRLRQEVLTLADDLPSAPFSA